MYYQQVVAPATPTTEIDGLTSKWDEGLWREADAAQWSVQLPGFLRPATAVQ